MVVHHFEIIWHHDGYGHKKFDNVRKWCFINHSKYILMLIKVHRNNIVWKSVVLDLLQFEGLLNKGIYWDNEENLFSIRKKKIIFKVTQKDIFVFFPNKYTNFLKELTRNIWYKLILHDNSSTAWRILAGLFRHAFSILVACNLLDTAWAILWSCTY